MAAASLGQVHRARLRDGRDVVVKIQYPGIDRALRSDIDNLGLVVKTMALAHRALDGRQYFHELAEELAHELDYSREGRLAQDHHRIATAMYREMDMAFWLRQAEAEPPWRSDGREPAPPSSPS